MSVNILKNGVLTKVASVGISVVDVKINASNHLICTLSDGTDIDCGELPKNGVKEYASSSAFPTTGESETIYISKDDNIPYRYDSEDGYVALAGKGDESVELTQAEYDALPSSKLTDGKTYFITDAGVDGVEISKQTGNSLTKKDDGLYVPSNANSADKVNHSLTINYAGTAGRPESLVFDGSEDKSFSIQTPTKELYKYSVSTKEGGFNFTEQHIVGSTPSSTIQEVDIDAKTLGTHSADYFATANDVSDVPHSSEESTVSIDTPNIDADKLGGQAPSYYATQSALNKVKSDLSSDLDNKTKWKRLGETTGNDSLSIPQDCNEILALCLVDNNYNIYIQINIPIAALNYSENRFRAGSAYNASNVTEVDVGASTSSIRVINKYVSMESKLSLVNVFFYR